MSISTSLTTSDKKRKRRAATRQSYREPEYDSDYDSLPEKTKKPSRHSARLLAAYNDHSDTETCTDSPPATTAHLQEVSFRGFKRSKSAQNNHEVKTPVVVKFSAPEITTTKIIPGGKIPPWQNLEYQILLKIMKYAAYPLYIGASQDTGSTAWLVQTSVISRSFHEAALGALLHTPPLFPLHRAHSITRLLKISRREFGPDISYPKQKKSSKISMDYRKKVQHLCIEARHVLVPKARVSLADLLHNTPNLKSLTVYHNHDFVSDKLVWAHPNYSKGKQWQYSEMYPVLAELTHSLALQHFEWNARFLTKDDGLLSKFREFHISSPYLQRLKSITIRNFIIDGVEKLNETVVGSSLTGAPESKPSTQQARLIIWRRNLKEALSKFKELKQLSICNSNIFDSASVAILPDGLKKLEIENCPCINNEGFESYLSSRGGQLKELILKGNQYLSLEFSIMLKTYTPMLSMLDVDLTYRDPTSYQDTEPLYDSLLPDGSPSWPESLERISIGPLRKLSAQDAKNFYQSLIDAAGQLKYLRVLELRTLLNEAGWRDRAALRTKWTAIFDEVFNVKYNPNIKPPGITEDDSSRRQSRRLKDLALTDSQGRFLNSQNGPPSPPTYSSLIETYRGSDEEDSMTTRGEPLVRQGRCHTVSFELSDQRPAQEQFREDDFLDSEADLEADSDYEA